MLTDQIIHDGRVVTLVWDEAPIPPNAPVTQVAGMCFTDGGEILLVSAGDDRWGLPGGHPEPGESWGAINEAPHYQLRFWARVELRTFAPRHEMMERALVLPTEFADRLAWGKSPIATELLAVALEIERQHL